MRTDIPLPIKPRIALSLKALLLLVLLMLKLNRIVWSSAYMKLIQDVLVHFQKASLSIIYQNYTEQAISSSRIPSGWWRRPPLLPPPPRKYVFRYLKTQRLSNSYKHCLRFSVLKFNKNRSLSVCEQCKLPNNRLLHTHSPTKGLPSKVVCVHIICLIISITSNHHQSRIVNHSHHC